MGFALALILLSCTVGFGTLIGRFAGLWVTRCDGEPYFIPQKIPFLGHIIGFMRFGTKYHLRIRSASSQPISCWSYITIKRSWKMLTALLSQQIFSSADIYPSSGLRSGLCSQPGRPCSGDPAETKDLFIRPSHRRCWRVLSRYE